jgi:hypothetical protein
MRLVTDPSRALGPVTDADVRAALTVGALEAVHMLRTMRHPESGELMGPKEAHARLQGATALLAAWARTVAPAVAAEPTRGQQSPEVRREAFVGLLRERPPELMAALEEAGIIPLTGEASCDMVLLDGQRRANEATR